MRVGGESPPTRIYNVHINILTGEIWCGRFYRITAKCRSKSPLNSSNLITGVCAARILAAN